MLILGLDGGGSNTRLAIATPNGEVLVTALGPGINPMDNGRWQANFDELLADAGAFVDNVKVAVLGLPGWGEVPRLDRQVSKYLQGRLRCELVLLNDVELAHRAAFNDGAGVLLLSGTGSMAIGLADDGKFLRAGGFGDLIGDEGSAHDIGRNAIASLASELDGRRDNTPFGCSLRDFLRLGNENPIQSLTTWLYEQSHPRSAIASIAAFVDQCAEEGDRNAQQLIANASTDLVRHYTAIVNRLGRGDLPWSYAGSTFKSNLFRDCVETTIGRAPEQPFVNAVGGALRIASKHFEKISTNQGLERIRTSDTPLPHRK